MNFNTWGVALDGLELIGRFSEGPQITYLLVTIRISIYRKQTVVDQITRLKKNLICVDDKEYPWLGFGDVFPEYLSHRNIELFAIFVYQSFKIWHSFFRKLCRHGLDTSLRRSRCTENV